MREIKIRGYAVEELIGDQWVYGTGVHTTEFTKEFADETGRSGETFIFTESGWIEVQPGSVGEFIGLSDKNGKEIYEGDIVTWFINNKEITAPIYFDDEQASFWMGKDVSGKMGLVLNDWMRGKYEVIGNQFENPELLEEVK